MLDRSRQMLVSEMSIARGIGDLEAAELLQKYLAKASLTLPPVY